MIYLHWNGIIFDLAKARNWDVRFHTHVLWPTNWLTTSKTKVLYMKAIQATGFTVKASIFLKEFFYNSRAGGGYKNKNPKMHHWRKNIMYIQQKEWHKKQYLKVIMILYKNMYINLILKVRMWYLQHFFKIQFQGFFSSKQQIRKVFCTTPDRWLNFLHFGSYMYLIKIWP